jgi:hypothetical protein
MRTPKMGDAVLYYSRPKGAASIIVHTARILATRAALPDEGPEALAEGECILRVDVIPLPSVIRALKNHYPHIGFMGLESPRFFDTIASQNDTPTEGCFRYLPD